MLLRDHVVDIRAESVPSTLTFACDGGDFEWLKASAADGAGEALPKFKMTAYNGGILILEGFYLPVVVDLAGLTIPSQTLPALMSHDAERRVGHTETIDNNGKRITAAGVVSCNNDDAKAVVADARNNFPWQVSIGASADVMVRVDSGEKVAVNNKTFTGPLLVARKATLRELSFVSIGADASSSAKVAAAAATSQTGVFSMNFEQWLKAKGLILTDLTEPVKAALQASYDAEIKAAAKKDDDTKTATTPGTPGTTPIQAGGAGGVTTTDQDPVAAIRAKSAAELTRINAIATVCGGKYPQIEAKAVAEGWSEDKAKIAVLEAKQAERPAGPAIHAGGKLADAPKAMEAAICIQAGVSMKRMGTWYDQETLNRASEKLYRGTTITALYHTVINAAGMYARPGKMDDDAVETALRAHRNLQASGGYSSLSLTNILENVAHKALLNSYQAQATTWQSIAAIRNHSDFKVHSQYRLDATGAFKKVAPDGELKHIGLSDAKYTNQLDTYGGIITMSRQMAINDDLGAFIQLPVLFGRMGALRIEEAVYVLLLSNPSNFFHANNRNLSTGAGSTVSVAGLTAAETLFSNQVDSNGKPILTPPTVLLTGTANFTDADVLYKDTTLVGSTTADVLKPSKNPHVSKYPPVKTPYLNNTNIKDQDGAAITGQSSTLWYLGADPAVRAAMGVAFLHGAQEPTVRSAEVNIQKLGVDMAAFIDFGVGMEDPTAMVKNNGA